MSGIDAHKEIEVSIVDIPNEFIQTNNPIKQEYQRDIIKIRSKLVQILVDIAPEMYEPYIKHGNGKQCYTYNY